MAVFVPATLRTSNPTGLLEVPDLELVQSAMIFISHFSSEHGSKACLCENLLFSSLIHFL
jgi:hypothetical protein